MDASAPRARALALSLCACTSAEPVEQPVPSPEPVVQGAEQPERVAEEPEREVELEREVEVPEPPVELASEGPTLALRPQHFEEAALRLQILDQAHSTHAWERGGVLSQTVMLEPDHVLRVLVRVGEGESLDPIPDYRPSVEFETPEAIELCGRPARRLVGHSPARRIACIEFADGTPSRPGYDAAQDYVIVGFEHGGLGATAEWSVPTRYRELYRPLEQAFFAQLGCPTPAP